ncbi:hypothetical protein V5O48_012682 [Marasmius crinis-equi]|uniref:Uncharacterized protein n=1 Tax=Marasmius crinis-equi TaxID=585013 RepID=A0ABR3F241_9AGAR
MSAPAAGTFTGLSEEQRDILILREQLMAVEAELAAMDDALDQFHEKVTCKHPQCGLILSKPHIDSRMKMVNGTPQYIPENLYEEHDLPSPRCPQCAHAIVFRPIYSSNLDELAANYADRFKLQRSLAIDLQWPGSHPLMDAQAALRYFPVREWKKEQEKWKKEQEKNKAGGNN